MLTRIIGRCIRPKNPAARRDSVIHTPVSADLTHRRSWPQRLRYLCSYRMHGRRIRKSRGAETGMSAVEDNDLINAFDQIPCGLFLLTSAYEGFRSCVLARWVQQCSLNPPLVMVALPKGSPVEPLIRDSHCFALCQIPDRDRFLARKFSIMPERSEDPFDTLATSCAPSGSPVVQRALSYLDCEVVRHVELESDCRLYVGEVRHGAMLNSGRPVIHLGGNGRIDEPAEHQQIQQPDGARSDQHDEAGDSAA